MDIVNEIDKTYEANRIEKERHHIGGSTLCYECDLKIFLTHRRALVPFFIGRMLRLFDRGKREEQVFADLLTSVGITVHLFNPKTGKQFKVSPDNKHLGGEIDGICLLPWVNNTPHLGEFKTHNDKSFKSLFDKNKNQLHIKEGKIEHWKQICYYGYHIWLKNNAITRYIYVAVNKNDDSLFIQTGDIDLSLGKDLTLKGNDIALTKIAPKKISSNPTYFKCTFCDFKNICHNNATVEKHCKTCQNVIPLKNGSWQCGLTKNILETTVACEKYSRLKL